jgi:hypothetical protein
VSGAGRARRGGGPEKTMQAVADRHGDRDRERQPARRSEKPDVSAQLAQVQNRGAPVDGYV